MGREVKRPTSLLSLLRSPRCQELMARARSALNPLGMVFSLFSIAHLPIILTFICVGSVRKMVIL